MALRRCDLGTLAGCPADVTVIGNVDVDEPVAAAALLSGNDAVDMFGPVSGQRPVVHERPIKVPGAVDVDSTSTGAIPITSAITSTGAITIEGSFT